MPEIKPNLSDQYRCISVHWSLPVQCILPCTHRENWHETWHPNGNRIRYRRSMGIFRTEELIGDNWSDLEIPPPGEVCGEPHTSKPGVFCQDPHAHGWTHHATVDGCRHTWHPAKQEPTPDQVAKDLSRVREIAVARQRIIDASDVIERSTREDVAKALGALRNGDFGEAQDLLGDLLESLR